MKTAASEALLDLVKEGHGHLPNCNSVLRNDPTKCDCEYTLEAIESEAGLVAVRAMDMLLGGIHPDIPLDQIRLGIEFVTQTIITEAHEAAAAAFDRLQAFVTDQDASLMDAFWFMEHNTPEAIEARRAGLTGGDA